MATIDTPLTVTLPSLGEDVDQAAISRWLVSPGDSIDADAPLLEVATDKVDTEIPAPCSGLLVEILVGEGETVIPGQALATIAVSPAAGTAEQNTGTGTTPPARPAATVDDSPAPAPASRAASNTGNRTPPNPSREHSLHVTAAGTGTTVVKLPRIRQTIAKRMMQSLHTSAQLTTVVEADVSGIAALRAKHKQRFATEVATKLTFLPFFAKATVEALEEHPVLTATVNADCTEVTYYDSVNLGIAVDGPKGLMVPVIRDAATLSISALAVAIADRAERVRAGTIGADDLAGGTFTITNTGSRGALFDTPILNQPQSGILGTGAVVERVVPSRDVNGSTNFAVRSMVYLAVTYDHRVVDGADAARFLSTIKQRLETGFTTDDVFLGVTIS